MVEMKLLSRYPSTYPDELKNRAPLMSHYVTEREVRTGGVVVHREVREGGVPLGMGGTHGVGHPAPAPG